MSLADYKAIPNFSNRVNWRNYPTSSGATDWTAITANGVNANILRDPNDSTNKKVC